MGGDEFASLEGVRFPDGVMPIRFYMNGPSVEVSISLFSNCNLRCKYCFEDGGHGSPEGPDFQYFREIPSRVAEAYSSKRKILTNAKTLILRIWGGEPFMDSLSDYVFDCYAQMVDDIKALVLARFPDTKFVTMWSTNGVFKKWFRVQKLLSSTDGVLSFSYDPCGRFRTDGQLETMISNYRCFEPSGVVKCVSITLTKPSIEAYVGGLSKLGVFCRTPIDVNYYTANHGWRELLPSASDIFSFYRWVFENRMFNVYAVSQAVLSYCGQAKTRFCDCNTCAVVRKDFTTTDCAYYSPLPKEMFYGKFAPEVDEGNANEVKAALGIAKFGCIECEHFSHCQMHCWISALFKEVQPECPLKMFYSFLGGLGKGEINIYIEGIRDHGDGTCCDSQR